MSTTHTKMLTAAAKGERTLIETFLALAKVHPDRLYGSICLTQSETSEFRDFTVIELDQAVDRCAWTIKEQFGVVTDHETLLCLCESDFRYTIMFFAAIKCGYKACFQNPQNPLTDNLAILEEMHCTKALYSSEFKKMISDYHSARPQLRIHEIPSLMDFFDCQLSPEFPYKAKPWNEAKHEPILVLHSSGTTGAPKPVVYQNGTLKGLDTAWRGEAGEMPLFDGMNGGFLYAPFPAFHSAGFLFMTVLPVFSQSTMVMPYAGENSAQNGHLALHIIKEKRTEMICVSPLVLKKISQCDEGVKILAGLKWVLYGGAPLPKSLGEHLSANGVNLVAIYGTTEATWIPTLLPASGHWDWLRFHPDAKIEWKQLENDEHTHELCFKNEGLAHNELRATHWTLKTDYWRSNDLFIRHPWKTDLWKYVGRKDDILVLAHAGMVNPVPVEDIIQSHPLIDGAIMAGAYRWPPCLLIEPRAGVEHHEKLRLDIWSIVEEANGILRQDNRIPMNKIMILAPNSLERNPKGGVVRYKSLRKHAETIQKCYAEDG